MSMPLEESLIVLLFDGRCGLCRSSMRYLRALDWFHRISFVNFHDAAMKEQYAPMISDNDLQGAMHIRLPDGRYLSGFFAFRRLCWSLPLLWVFAPLLCIPGVPTIGQVLYRSIAKHRS